jgi:hypothetical protein
VGVGVGLGLVVVHHRRHHPLLLLLLQPDAAVEWARAPPPGVSRGPQHLHLPPLRQQHRPCRTHPSISRRTSFNPYRIDVMQGRALILQITYVYHARRRARGERRRGGWRGISAWPWWPE